MKFSSSIPLKVIGTKVTNSDPKEIIEKLKNSKLIIKYWIYYNNLIEKNKLTKL